MRRRRSGVPFCNLKCQAFHLFRSLVSTSSELFTSSCKMVQVMGPDDSYLIQYSEDNKCFWADPGSLALGASFKPAGPRAPPRVAVTEVDCACMWLRSQHHTCGIAPVVAKTCCWWSPRLLLMKIYMPWCRRSSMRLWQRASRRRSLHTTVSA